MDKNYLNKKWLVGDLTNEEREVFEQIEDNNLLKEIVNKAPAFRASNFSNPKDFESLQAKINNRNLLSKKHNWLIPMLRIAAVLVVGFSIYFMLFSNNNINIETAVAEKRMVQLPDASEVTLNAVSEIIYNQDTWAAKRELRLDGEAFFKVAKGSTFDVNTSVGKVTVVGTQFNVKNRPSIFEVTCFEGQVTLTYGMDSWKVLPGYIYRISNGKVTSEMVTNNQKPLWMANTSYFKKVPFHEVIEELERQFNVEISMDANDESLIFTGGFKHGNLQEALESITTPLKLKYVINSPSKISLHHLE